MNRKQKKELRERQSTRQLMGITQLTDHGVKTAKGELVFFMLRPDNLSVLSPEGVRGRVTALTNLLRATPAVRFLAMDSRESFQANQDFYHRRLEAEPLPAVRELLRQDAAHLDDIQATTASAREFALVYPVDTVAASSISFASPQAAKLTHSAAAPLPTRTASLGSRGDPSSAADPRQTEKSLRDGGFHVRLADTQDIKRILSVYYQRDIVAASSISFAPPQAAGLAHSAASPLPTRTASLGSRGGPKDFLDMAAPSVVKFNTDQAIIGCGYHTFLSLRGYAASTEELALLSRLGAKDGVNLSLYARQVTAAEEKQIIQNASNKNRLTRSNTNDLQQSVAAESDLQDVAALVTQMHRSREPLIHCAVFIDISAPDMAKLSTLKDFVTAELARCKLTPDPLLLRQREGFQAANPAGFNAFGSQFERVLPASSVANLDFFNYSGKTDPRGFYVGRDRYGSNVIVDLDRRAEDKTTASVLILGNSGQGKSHLLKLLLCNILESGKSAICLDPEHELIDLCANLGGCFVDLMDGRYRINPLEPKAWDVGAPIEAQRSGFDGERSRSGMSELSPSGGSEGYEACGDDEDDENAPATFRQRTLLSQHISFLKDFFRSYKDFTDAQIDTIELMLERLYAKWGLDDGTDFAALAPGQFPILSDLYDVIEDAYENYGDEANPLYPKELLREILLGLHSLCRGAESKFFNGHTNITSSRFLVFGVKGLLQASKNVKDAMLFNVLSYLSDKLLTVGNTVATLDELYIWLSNVTTIEYIRNTLKRVRKKESALILASQNLEDFDVDGIRELTRPLFAIPTHQFLFNAGSVDKKFYMDNLQLEGSEYELIRYPQRGVCLYKCGNERYLLEVHAPDYKEKLFGEAGGR